MGSLSRQLRRKLRGCGIIALFCLCAPVFIYTRPPATQQTSSAAAQSQISVRYTDVRKQAGITFQQDSTQTEEKYYLETMGTGLAWLDFDQDGLMDLFFVQSAATDIYKPTHPLR